VALDTTLLDPRLDSRLVTVSRGGRSLYSVVPLSRALSRARPRPRPFSGGTSETPFSVHPSSTRRSQTDYQDEDEDDFS
jgi:hypothetical protein